MSSRLQRPPRWAQHGPPWDLVGPVPLLAPPALGVMARVPIMGQGSPWPLSLGQALEGSASGVHREALAMGQGCFLNIP